MADVKPHPAGISADFPEGRMVTRHIEGRDLVFLRRQGRMTCFADECPHQPVKLSEFGEVQGGRLVCHAHGGTFDLDGGGRVLCPPPLEGLHCFVVTEKNSQVTVFI